MDDENDSSFGCLGIIVTIVILYFVFRFFGGIGKYEGESAEYWFNEYDAESAQYDELKTCVEDNPHDAMSQCF